MRYFIILDGRQIGPIDREKLIENGLERNTYVWCSGMQEWQKAEEVVDLQYLIAQIPPVLPTSTANQATDKQTSSTSERDSQQETIITEESPLESKQSKPQREKSYINKPVPFKTWKNEALILSIVSFVFCCFLSGIVGLVALFFANESETYFQRNIVPIALEKAKNARTLIYVGMAIGLFTFIANIIYVIFGLCN